MVGKWLGKNSTDWLNKSASSGSQSRWCMPTLLTDARAWLVRACPPLGRQASRRIRSHFCHLLPGFPALSILNFRSFQSRLSSVLWQTWFGGRPPGCLDVGFRGSLHLGQWQLYCLQPSLSTGVHSHSPGRTGVALPQATFLAAEGWLNFPVCDLASSCISKADLSFGDSSRPGALRMQLGLWETHPNRLECLSKLLRYPKHLPFALNFQDLLGKRSWGKCSTNTIR